MMMLSILEVITNVCMVIHNYRENNSFGAGFLFKLIGICNAACGICLCTQAIAISANAIPPLPWVLSMITSTVFFLQLGFNVSLAFERYKVVINAADYCSSNAKRKLEKKLALAVFTIALLLSILIAIVRYLYSNVLIQSVPFAATRIIGYILFCVLYGKLFFTMRSQSQAIAPSSVEQGLPTAISQKSITRRRRQLEHSKRFFIGITSSYFILNLPIMVAFFIIDENPNCHTFKGIFSLLSIGLSVINMIFDSVWYFYMAKRSRRS